MNRLSELLTLVEFVAPKSDFKVYCENPYGSGFDRTPLKRGEMIPMDSGESAEFITASEDGTQVVAKVNGETKKFKPKDLGCIILPASADLSKRSDFVKEEAERYDSSADFEDDFSDLTTHLMAARRILRKPQMREWMSATASNYSADQVDELFRALEEKLAYAQRAADDLYSHLSELS